MTAKLAMKFGSNSDRHYTRTVETKLLHHGIGDTFVLFCHSPHLRFADGIDKMSGAERVRQCADGRSSVPCRAGGTANRKMSRAALGQPDSFTDPGPNGFNARCCRR